MDQNSKPTGDATERGEESRPTMSMAERMLQSHRAEAEDTEQSSSPRLNRAQIRALIRNYASREVRIRYFFGLHRYPSKLLPRPSSFVTFRNQIGASVEQG